VGFSLVRREEHGKSMAACYKLSTMIARAGHYLEGTFCDPGP